MDNGLADFASLVRTPEPALDLAVGAALIARIETPGLAGARCLARLDELADESRAGHVADPVKALHRLREFLFEEQGFAGNSKDYYDPRNSCLNDVVERRVGIPITLSIVLMEVGRRVGLPIVGVGLPGHFVVRADVGPEPVLLDPFDGGAVVTPERAADLVARALGRRVPIGQDQLASVDKRQILMRMLMNLRGIYCRRSDWDKALAVFDRLLVLDTETLAHHRDRGTVLVKLGQYHQGVQEWERYLNARPQAEDAADLREQLRHVRQRLASLN